MDYRTSWLMKSSVKSWLPGFLALGIIWGLSFLFIKVGLEWVTITGVPVLRALLGAFTLVFWSLVTRVPFITKPKFWAHIFVVALLLNAFPSVMFAWAETMVSSSLSGILNATTPLMTALAMLFIFRGEKLKVVQVLGLILGFLGVIILSGQFGKNIPENPLAIALLLLATASYGIGFPYARKFLSDTGYSATSLATAQLIATVVLVSPLAISQPMFHASASALPAVSIFLLGAFGTGFAYIWNFRTIALAGSAIASTVTYLAPVVSVIAGWLLLSEPLHWNIWIGAIVILLSAALVQQKIRFPMVKS
jgi:drug/metabolite transporter (DMT)-like permease